MYGFRLLLLFLANNKKLHDNIMRCHINEIEPTQANIEILQLQKVQVKKTETTFFSRAEHSHHTYRL